MASRIAVATTDTLAARMAGPAIRAVQMATALAGDGHDVRLVTTATAVIDVPGVRVDVVDDLGMAEVERWCDVFVFQGFVLHRFPFLLRSEKVIVADIYDPFHLEQMEVSRDETPFRRRELVQASTAVLNEQLLRADFMLCASPKQRDFWLGHLAALGRVNPAVYDEDETLYKLIDIAPFGLPEHAPQRTRPAIKGVIPGIAATDKVVLWGGGIYNWFDPLTLIRAVHELEPAIPDLRLLFLGTKHPNPEVPAMRMTGDARQLAADLGVAGRTVFFNDDWVEYDDRHNFLLDADVGVSTHFDHAETAYSFRTRILDYLWAGLPTVTTGGDALGDLIDAEDLGRTVPPTDVGALRDALAALLTDPTANAACRERIAAVAPRFRWSAALAPLLEFCRRPRRAPDLLDPDITAAFLRSAGVVHAEHRGLLADARVAAAALRDGGPRLLASKVRNRLAQRHAHR